MRIGLIARDEVARGLAIQTKGFHDNMPVDRTLIVRKRRPDCALGEDWYRNATIVEFNETLGTLDETVVCAWLEGLDVVFTAETVYDWDLIHWAHDAGVKVVVQGNPEFVRHPRADLPDPDAWWWPTTWRTDQLPEGKLMPVPMDFRLPSNGWPEEGPLKIVHVVGKRALGDRNGTEILMKALGRVTTQIELTIFGIDGELPSIGRVNPRVKIHAHPHGVDDRWEMYHGQHILVLPRRYGGLCLPALEAASCSVAVMMTDCRPNAELATIMVPARRTRPLRVPAGMIDAHEVNPLDLSNHLDYLARHRNVVVKAQQDAYENVTTWDMARPSYMLELDLLTQGEP